MTVDTTCPELLRSASDPQDKGDRAVRYYGIKALPIYSTSNLNIFAMTEYEWEVRRVPRARTPGTIAVREPRPSALRTYVDLEFPRESLTWLLGSRPGPPPERDARGDPRGRAARAAESLPTQGPQES